MQHNAAFHQGLYFLLKSKQFPGTEIHQNLNILTCGPLRYIMDNPILIAFMRMGESIRIQSVQAFFYLSVIRSLVTERGSYWKMHVLELFVGSLIGYFRYIGVPKLKLLLIRFF